MEQRIWPPSILLTGQTTFAEEYLSNMLNPVEEGFDPTLFFFKNGGMWQGWLPLRNYIAVRSEMVRQEVANLCDAAMQRWQ